MAKVKHPLHSDSAAGHVGSVVYRDVRNKGLAQAMPTAEWIDSTKRRARINSMIDLSATWRALDPDQRALWRSFAALHPQTDRWNRPFYLSGFAWYMKCNGVLDYHGSDRRVIPPDWIDPLRISAPSATADGPDILLGWSLPDGNGTDMDVVDIWLHYRTSFGRAPDRPSAIIKATPAIYPSEIVWQLQPAGNYTWWLRATNALSGLQLYELEVSLTHDP